MRASLQGSPLKPVNILMCHHHPHQHAELGLGADDVMVDWGKPPHDAWVGRIRPLVCAHGHKHHPKITFCTGRRFRRQLCLPRVVFAQSCFQKRKRRRGTNSTSWNSRTASTTRSALGGHSSHGIGTLASAGRGQRQRWDCLRSVALAITPM